MFWLFNSIPLLLEGCSKILLLREGGVPVGGGGRSLNQVVNSGGVVGLPSLTTYHSQLPSQQTTRPPTANTPSARSKHPLTCGLMPTTCEVIPNSLGRRTWRSIIRQRTPHVAPLAINALLVTIQILSRFLPFSFQRLQPSI